MRLTLALLLLTTTAHAQDTGPDIRDLVEKVEPSPQWKALTDSEKIHWLLTMTLIQHNQLETQEEKLDLLRDKIHELEADNGAHIDNIYDTLIAVWEKLHGREL